MSASTLMVSTTSTLRAALLLACAACVGGAFNAPAAQLAGHSRAAVHRHHAPLCNAADEKNFLGRFEENIALFEKREELPQIRRKNTELQAKLADAVAMQDFVSAAMLRDDLAELRRKDPAVMASTLREEMARHVKRERFDEAARCRDELLVLRRFLPQYQLAGLWKGNYPNHGDETVRIHYDGDQLYATKVTGDEHVPAGEVTFRADLTSSDANGDFTSKSASGGDDAVAVRVEVLSLSSDEGQKPREVEQFLGEGRIAARGFKHPHYVPGRLFLMDDDVIGFLWMPIGTFVVFSRVPEDDEPDFEKALEAIKELGLDASAISPLDVNEPPAADDEPPAER